VAVVVLFMAVVAALAVCLLALGLLLMQIQFIP
jgi:hypothetical protein